MIEKLIYILAPAILVLVTAWFLLKKLLNEHELQRRFELRKNTQNLVTPIRLRAYERLMLLVERTHPEKLVLNTYKAGMTVFELQNALTANLRQEFSHNISQQIYVSAGLWNEISNVQQTLLKLINLVASKLEPNADGTILAQGVISIYDEPEVTPIIRTTELLKNEVTQFF
jgi:hypothetical protein